MKLKSHFCLSTEFSFYYKSRSPLLLL